MSFVELVAEIKRIPCDEQRKQYEGYCEVVLATTNLSDLYPVLEKYFGVPFKPAGVNPSKQAKEAAEMYGGIEKQQTLYFFKKDGLAHCAMIWPWGDGSKATVKVAQGKMKDIA